MELLSHPLAHLAEATVAGQSEEVHHRGGLVGIEVSEEHRVDADRILRSPVGVQEVGVGQVGDDFLGSDTGGEPTDRHDTRIVGEDSGEDFQQRRFPTSVGTHQTDDVPGIQ